MNGSGIPMRFADTDGSMIDVYQATTQMTDESGQTYPFTADTLLDRALGPPGLLRRVHREHAHRQRHDLREHASCSPRPRPAASRSSSARQMLTWIDGRNGSSFADLSWSGSTLSFSIGVGSGASRLTAMLPTSGPGATTLSGISRGGTSVPFTTLTVKGQEYALFAAAAGAWTATYAAAGAPAVLAARVSVTAGDEATVAWSTEEPATSSVRFGTSSDSLDRVASAADSTTRHRVGLDALAPGATYYYRVVSRTPEGRTRTWPAATRPPARFHTSAVDTLAPMPFRTRVVSLPDGTARVTWRTTEPSTSEVRYSRLGRSTVDSRRDDHLVRRHAVVLTGLRARTAYRLSVHAADASGNEASGRPIALRTRPAGVAVQTEVDFRAGRTGGDLRVSDAGFGTLTLPRGGAGSFVSGVLDARQKVRWTGFVLDSRGSRNARWVMSVRTGSGPTPDRSWTGWHRARRSDVDAAGRYLQFRIRVATPRGTRWSAAAVGFTHDGNLQQIPGELERQRSSPSATTSSIGRTASASRSPWSATVATPPTRRQTWMVSTPSRRAPSSRRRSMTRSLACGQDLTLGHDRRVRVAHRRGDLGRAALVQADQRDVRLEPVEQQRRGRSPRGPAPCRSSRATRSTQDCMTASSRFSRCGKCR